MKRLFGGLVSALIKGMLRLLCRIDAEELRKIPADGACLLVMNHVNFLEVPIIYLFLRPRKLYSLVKEETWKNPVIGYLADIWDAIPIRRGTADFKAFGAAEKVFMSGHPLIMAPEGTRSGDGVLRRAHGGAVLLAFHNGVPVYPIAHTGSENFYRAMRRFRRVKFTVRVGRPFFVMLAEGEKFDASVRREITGEIMGRIAALLPEGQRGVYADAASGSPRHLRFLDA